ncbi:1-phosphofructokinase [Pseudolactococcus paracarnosus]|uniref:Tagatose-6-phosphate kinase n=1 Tax=Pseudolactococcus paracarnosus TaxID=2749962 RepID=A0A7L4WEU6_9LACT|nr:1-phosphofructokinase [Lactococcus paracarnosus]SPC37365.1 fructose-1-phosphate kinase [Lactococcus piscium]MCJ1976740.1 1-phosphofructokinase [Lactococcus paracarnosus]MCJ1982874.1 1-phosphofructokinase [Lactococcus paracarnosus]MCJ1993387.1 1-phosphofructokinase [Lactococcus paracarnosus]MCJ1997395.1 1-phosphofructokinase [Lactococcus paracarnosus]
MIYTVTLNPSIDFLVRLPEFKVGEVNRMTSDDKFPGGKGINVSRILARIESNSTAFGFLGGFTGDFIKEKLQAEAIVTDFVKIAADTRINVKIKSDIESEINGAGPEISEAERAQFFDKLAVLTPSDIVVLAGSAPASLGQDFYLDVINKIKAQGAEFVIDIEGDVLVKSLANQPLVVKPNNHELGAIYGVEFETVEELIPYGHKLLSDGAKYAMISMAGDGALLFADGKTYFAKAVKGVVKNSVGAGDSMIAGFVGEFAKSHDAVKAFRQGVACGTATAFSDDLASAEFIQEISEQVVVEER